MRTIAKDYPKVGQSSKKGYYFIALYLTDILMFALALIVAFMLFPDSHFTILKELQTHIRLAIIMAFILIMNYSYHNMYDDKRNLFSDNDVVAIIYSVTTTYFIAGVTIIAFEIFKSIPEKFLLASYLLVILFTIISRLTLARIVIHFRKKGKDLKKVILYGKDSFDIESKIKDNPGLGYRLIAKTESLKELKKMLDKTDIVFLSKDTLDEKMTDLIVKNSRVSWKIIPSAFNLVMDRVDFDEFKDSPIINIPASNSNSGYMRLKRVIDIVVSGISLVILSPLFLFVALMIKLTMPGPVFFKHKRLGKNLKEFTIYKFRSMVVNADSYKKDLLDQNEVRGLFKMKDDPRVTLFGKFLRKTCIDELPQLINIFKGDMSLVGPRPHLRSELHHFKGWRKMRFSVKPGLTGLWQVSGRHQLNFDKAVLYDIYYIKHMSLLLDIKIILRTIPAILFSGGRW